MDVKISGTVAQTVGFSLMRVGTLWASKGSLISHTPGLEWDVRVPGGLSAGIKRLRKPFFVAEIEQQTGV
ncbi:MAG: hypothetical protein GY752_00235 [bacterium]|nr:hypothetical protein [bacterium]MCP4801081.1 hypothetical protein [bacterium]